jgi:hypothetical protein
LDVLVTILVSNVFKHVQARALLGVDVHVVDFWLLDEIKILLLGHFLLEHFHFFLIFLDAVVNTMDQDISVNYFLFGKCVRCLFVSEPTST